jgi:hypothetical protein
MPGGISAARMDEAMRALADPTRREAIGWWAASKLSTCRKKSTRPATCFPTAAALVLPIGSCQQQACRGAGRPDHHPPLGAPVVRPGRGVLHQLKAQTPTKKLIAGS